MSVTPPNPFATSSTLQYDFHKNDLDDARLEVYNLLGQKVETDRIVSTSGTISWGSSLNKGIYILKIVNGSSVQKITDVVKLN